jgi:hypothetical protein
VSTLAYAAITANREAATPGTSETNAPGLKTYVDALAALVPAEALALHVAILGWTTDTKNGKLVYTDKNALKVSFYGLVLLTVVLYVGRHAQGTRTNKWGWSDIPRAAIPALAFIAWTMAQRPSAFDVVTSVRLDRRYIVAAFAAIILGLVAARLGGVADASNPGTAGSGSPGGTAASGSPGTPGGTPGTPGGGTQGTPGGGTQGTPGGGTPDTPGGGTHGTPGGAPGGTAASGP